MQISSPAFEAQSPLPQKYTCDGENISPPLQINGVPEEAQSLALIVDDPDAPAGTWVHWVVWNIAPDTHEIPENTSPAAAVEGTTSFGKPGYGGPCPPSGTHRYFFKVFALDQNLDLSSEASAKDLENAMKSHIIDQSEFYATYSREG